MAVFRMTTSVVLGNASFEKGYIMHPLSIKSILGRNYEDNILPTPRESHIHTASSLITHLLRAK